MKKFSDITSPLYEKFFLNNKEIKVLKKIKDKLLPKLISGKLNLSFAEKLFQNKGI